MQELGGSAFPGELGCPMLTRSAAKPVNNKLCLPCTGPCVLRGVSWAGGMGKFGGEKGFFHIREAALSGGEELEGRSCPRDPRMCGQYVYVWDAVMMCAQEPGVQASPVPGILCFVPRDWGPVQGWCPHPQPRKGRFLLCHKDHLGQSAPGILVPHPGLGSLCLLTNGSRWRMGLCSTKPTPIPPKE